MKHTLPSEVRRFGKAAAGLLIAVLLVFNPLNLTFISSLHSQEWLLYHVRDALEYATAGGQKENGDYFLATGTYETAEKNEYFGAAAGKNLIIVQLESFQNMVVGKEYRGQEITPCMNRWLREEGSLYFDSFFQQIASGNTSDAEFAVNNSLLGTIESYTYSIYADNYFRGLPWLLKEAGYQTAVMHGFKKSFWNRENIYPVLGFDTFINDDILINDHIVGIGSDISGISDEAFYRQCADILEEMDQQEAPFYSFLISLSSHHPFRLPAQLSALELDPRDEGSTFGNYMNSIHYADKCFGMFLDLLKEKGLYDHSLIVAYGDHFGLIKSDERTADWLGHEYRYDTMMNIPLVIHLPGVTEPARTLTIAGGQTDILPTVAWLLGLEELDTLYLGQNLLTAEEGFVAEKTHLLKGSFINDEIVFEIARDGVFANSRVWDRKTGREIPVDGLEEDSLRAKRIIETGKFYLDEDIIGRMYRDGKSFDRILADLAGRLDFPLTLKSITLAGSLKEKFQLTGMRPDHDTDPDVMTLPEFARWMADHPGEQVMVGGDNLLQLLTQFERMYSGKGSRNAILYVKDEAMAKRFEDIRRRTTPGISSLSDWTKTEYLGYRTSVFVPDPVRYTEEEILEFLSYTEPSGVLMPENIILSANLRAELSAVPFQYARDPGTFLGRARLKAAGIDGLARTGREPATGAQRLPAAEPEQLRRRAGHVSPSADLHFEPVAVWIEKGASD